MRTKTVGDLLQEKRTARRLSFEKLAEKTRIRADYLQFLEDDQFEKLPAASFVKGYIRAYGRILGFDSQPLIALLRRDYKESAKGKLVPREFLKPVLKRRQSWTPATVVLLSVASAFFVLFSYVGVQWYNMTKPPRLDIYSPAEDAFVAAQVVVEGLTLPGTVVVVNAQPVSVSADGTFQTQVYLPREGISTITVESTDSRNKTSTVQRTVYVKF